MGEKAETTISDSNTGEKLTLKPEVLDSWVGGGGGGGWHESRAWVEFELDIKRQGKKVENNADQCNN